MARGVRQAALARRLLALATSAVCMSLAVPPSRGGMLAWVALVPLALAILGERPWRAALWGALFGAMSLAGMHRWLWQLPAFNVFDAVALFGYLAVYPALWCAALAALASRRLPWVFPGAVLWVLLDWARAHAGPLALPWEPLAHSLTADVPLLQLAALGGAPLISFVICLVNLALARAWQKRSMPRFSAIVIGAGAIHACGYLAIPATPVSAGIRVAIIQPADDNASPAANLESLQSLTRRAAKDQPGLIIWPESAVNGYASNPAMQAFVAEIARSAQAPVLFGSADFGKFAKSAGTAAEHVQFRNQAFFVSPDRPRQEPYTKNQLVPFGEFMPFANYIEWPRWLVSRQLHGIAGDGPGLFHLRDGTTLGVVICWENYFTDLAARLAHHNAAVIIQLSNDADFGASAEPAQHNAATILRAVEYGRPWIQASMNGPSMLVDAYGRVISSLGPVGTPAWAVKTVSPSVRTTVYARFGLSWLWVVTVSALILVIYRLLLRRRSCHATHTTK